MNQFLRVIGVPFALGGSKEGPARGPDALVQCGLLDELRKCAGVLQYVDVKERAAASGMFSVKTNLVGGISSFHSVFEVTKLSGAQVFLAHRLGYFPIVIGGDHSVSIGTLPQFLDPSLSHGRKVGLLWIDAHYDAHTPKTTHSHYANGLPFASVLGRGPKNLGSYRVHVGGRKRRLRFLPPHTLHIGAGESDCEPEEVALLEKLHVKRVTMQDIYHRGMPAIMEPLARLLDGVDDLILTIDLDSIRRDFAPAVSFQSKSGMLPSHIFPMARLVAQSGKLRQIEIMEYNPDFEEYTMSGSPKTAHLVFDLLAQLLRK